MKSLCEIINVNIFYGEKTNGKHCYLSLSNFTDSVHVKQHVSSETYTICSNGATIYTDVRLKGVEKQYEKTAWHRY